MRHEAAKGGKSKPTESKKEDKQEPKKDKQVGSEVTADAKKQNAKAATNATSAVVDEKDELLRKKKHAELLEPFEARRAAVVAYLRRCRPALRVETSALLDPKAPPKVVAGVVRPRRASRETPRPERKLSLTRVEGRLTDASSHKEAPFLSAEIRNSRRGARRPRPCPRSPAS